MIFIRLCWEPDIYFKQLHYQRNRPNPNTGEVGTFLGKKMPYFNILISLWITNGSHYLALSKQRTELVTNKIYLLPEGHGFHIWQHSQRSSGDSQVIEVCWVFISFLLFLPHPQPAENAQGNCPGFVAPCFSTSTPDVWTELKFLRICWDKCRFR